MPFFFSFWGCSSRAAPEATPPELTVQRQEMPGALKITPDFYDQEGQIKWADEAVKKKLFALGFKHNSIENFVFLDQVHQMRLFLERNQPIPPNEKDPQTRIIAEEIYYKHLAQPENLREYSLTVGKETRQIRQALNRGALTV